ncbi:MAG TPA: hypothetical protein DET40_16765 [Lentisphaeria bacterium]|nr:MAG: hypothetical protein A2X45_04575 [Lentisphaerae bacterium GWF2_50_93]HCE45193.1 hypothetical protein [Lentisphaeria bacterium]
MSLEKLNEFGGYRKSLELFDCVVDDMRKLRPYPETHRLISQQIASADSICSNMEEGAGRWSKKEYVQFVVISRGSAAETRGRYLRMKTWLPKDIIEKRVAICDEIIGILTSTINKLK